MEDRDISMIACYEENCISIELRTSGVITNLSMDWTIESAREYRDWLNVVLAAHDARA